MFMKGRKTLLSVSVLGWFLNMSLPAFAHVERVVVETEGLSNACRAGLEAALNSMESVYKYAIDVEKQMFSVTYFSGEKFDAKKLHWAADKGEAYVLKIRASASGKIRQEGEQQIFEAGEDRFLIVSPQKLPTDVNIGMVGFVDDSKEILQFTPDNFTVLSDEPDPAEAPKAGTEESHEK
jgi:hypothetical protein